MAQAAIAGAVLTWAPAYESTMRRVEVRNVGQGGNNFLAAIPLGSQAMWAGALMAEVAAVVSGPFYAIAQFFRILFNPFISFPFSLISCAVKEGFYEKSVSATSAERTWFFERGQEVAAPIKGTISLLVNGVERHFTLGENIDWFVDRTIEDGGKRYWYNRLEANEVFDDQCREVEIDGERIRIRLELEASSKQFVERLEGGERHYYELGTEVTEPIQGTMTVPIPFGQVDWAQPIPQRARYYLLNEIPNEVPDCVKLKSKEQVLFYDTGEELSEAQPGSKSFMIDGVERYFATAKYVRHESQGLSGYFNMISEKWIHCSILPVRLSRIAAKTLSFLSQHLSAVIRISMIVAGAVLLYFGHIAMAIGALAAVTYEYLDHDLGVIPHKVSLFMEKWVPVISMMGLLIVGSGLTQVMAGVSLLLTIPAVRLFLHQKVAKVMRTAVASIAKPLVLWFVRDARGPIEGVDRFVAALKTYPQLEDCDAPLDVRKDLSAAEIDEILGARNEEYELNPAILTKNVDPPIQLEENTDFNTLIDLWDRRGDRWIGSYPSLLARLADDKRFILSLQQRFPEAKRFFFEYDGNNRALSPREQRAVAWDRYIQDIEAWIQPLAREQNITKEQFVVNYCRQQLQNYVNKLSGDKPIEGEQRYLRDAIENTSKILPFLIRLGITLVDLEDTLKKLAIEGGDYCSLAMARASGELLQGFIAPQIAQLEERMSPHQRFENEVLREFQTGRLRAIQAFYQQATEMFRETEQFQDTADDVHLYMALSLALKRGFYPLSEEEMAEFSMMELFWSEMIFLPFRMSLQSALEALVPDAMNRLSIDRQHAFHDDVHNVDINHNRVLNYLRAWVEASQQLSDVDKRRLLGGPLQVSRDQLADPDNYPKWYRLMLTVLGVYRKKVIPNSVENSTAPMPGPVLRLFPIHAL